MCLQNARLGRTDLSSHLTSGTTQLGDHGLTPLSLSFTIYKIIIITPIYPKVLPCGSNEKCESAL